MIQQPPTLRRYHEARRTFAGLLQNDELMRQKRIDFGALHVDLIGSISHEHQSGDFVRT
jgi:hypothetical protein